MEVTALATSGTDLRVVINPSPNDLSNVLADCIGNLNVRDTAHVASTPLSRSLQFFCSKPYSAPLQVSYIHAII
jgi:hypothetical protein